MGTSQVENKTVKGTGKGPSSKGQVPCWIYHQCTDTFFAMDLSMAIGKIMDILFSDSISYIYYIYIYQFMQLAGSGRGRR